MGKKLENDKKYKSVKPCLSWRLSLDFFRGRFWSISAHITIAESGHDARVTRSNVSAISEAQTFALSASHPLPSLAFILRCGRTSSAVFSVRGTFPSSARCPVLKDARVLGPFRSPGRAYHRTTITRVPSHFPCVACAHSAPRPCGLPCSHANARPSCTPLAAVPPLLSPACMPLLHVCQFMPLHIQRTSLAMPPSSCLARLSCLPAHVLPTCCASRRLHSYAP